MNPAELIVMIMCPVGIGIILLVIRWAFLTQDKEIDNPPPGEKENK
jgi:hypothetical protein